jgi:hypothetical protein
LAVKKIGGKNLTKELGGKNNNILYVVRFLAEVDLKL